MDALSLARMFDEFLDLGPDALGDRAAAAGHCMHGVPFDALLPARLGRHAMQPVPFLVQGHLIQGPGVQDPDAQENPVT